MEVNDKTIQQGLPRGVQGLAKCWDSKVNLPVSSKLYESVGPYNHIIQTWNTPFGRVEMQKRTHKTAQESNQLYFIMADAKHSSLFEIYKIPPWQKN